MLCVIMPRGVMKKDICVNKKTKTKTNRCSVEASKAEGRVVRNQSTGKGHLRKAGRSGRMRKG